MRRKKLVPGIISFIFILWIVITSSITFSQNEAIMAEIPASNAHQKNLSTLGILTFSNEYWNSLLVSNYEIDEPTPLDYENNKPMDFPLGEKGICPGFSVSITDSANILCNGESTGYAIVTPVGGTAPYTYNWDTAPVQTDSTATGLAAGTYKVIVTDFASCEDSVYVTLTEPTAVTADAGTNTIICAGNNTVIGGSPTANGGAGSYTYAWEPSISLDDTTLSNPNASPIINTTYNLTVSDVDGCVAISSVIVTVNPNSTVVAGSDASVCEGNDYTLIGASIGGSATSQSWTTTGDGSFDNNTLLNPVYTPAGADIGSSIYLTIETDDPDGAGPCTSVFDAISLTTNETATISAGSDATICAGNSYSISGATIGGSATGQLWTTSGDGTYNNSNLLLPTYIPGTADISGGTTNLVLSNLGPCIADNDTLILTINPQPSTSAIAGPASSCENEAGLIFSVTNTAGSSYVWTIPLGASITSGAGTNSITVTVGSASGGFTVTETDANGCVGQIVTF